MGFHCVSVFTKSRFYLHHTKLFLQSHVLIFLQIIVCFVPIFQALLWLHQLVMKHICVVPYFKLVLLGKN